VCGIFSCFGLFWFFDLGSYILQTLVAKGRGIFILARKAPNSGFTQYHEWCWTDSERNVFMTYFRNSRMSDSLFIKHVQAVEYKINYLQHAKTKQISVVNFACSRFGYFSTTAVFTTSTNLILQSWLTTSFELPQVTVTSFLHSDYATCFVCNFLDHEFFYNPCKTLPYLLLRRTFFNFVSLITHKTLTISRKRIK